MIKYALLYWTKNIEFKVLKQTFLDSYSFLEFCQALSKIKKKILVLRTRIVCLQRLKSMLKKMWHTQIQKSATVCMVIWIKKKSLICDSCLINNCCSAHSGGFYFSYLSLFIQFFIWELFVSKVNIIIFTHPPTPYLKKKSLFDSFS